MKKIVQLITVLGVAGLFAGTPLFADNTNVYIASASDGVYLSTLNDETGSLSEPKLAAKIKGSGFLAIHPNNKVLYTTVTLEGKQGGVAAYSIAKDGSLTQKSLQKNKDGGLCHISLDASADLLMGANYRGGSVVSFSLEKDGSISQLASHHQHEGSSVNEKRQKGPHAHSIYSGPQNKFVYAPDLGIDKVMIYTIDNTSDKLIPFSHSKTPAGGGPRHMKFGKDGKQAYVLNELFLSVTVYDVNSVSGQLTQQQTVSNVKEGTDKEQMTCSEIRVSKDGEFVYCANRDLAGKKRDSVSVFSAGSGGKLTLIQTINAEVWIPRNINLDPSGKWLLVAGQKSNDVPVFKIDQVTGMLSYTGNKISVPKPMCIVLSGGL